VPRVCPAQIATLGAVLLAAALTPAHAQTADPAAVFQPADGDPISADRFRPAGSGLRVSERSRFGDIPGPADFSGAGATGFDSTNTRRRRAPASRTRASAAASDPMRVPIRPVPNPGRRGAASAQDPAGGSGAVLVPAIATPTRRRAPAPEEDPFAPVGLRAGAITLWPAIELSGGYDTNPAHVQGNKGSAVFIVAPELRLRSDWERHALNADIRGSYIAYPQRFSDTVDCGCGDGSTTVTSGVPQSLDRPSLDSRVDGRIDITSRSRVDVEGRLLVGTDNPGSPNIQAGLVRLPIVTTVGTTLGYAQQFNRFEIAAKGSFDRSVYQQSQLTDGTTASNDDRNFNQHGFVLRGSYEVTPALRPFVEAGIDNRTHDLSVDRNGQDRDSNGYSVKAGTTFEFSRKLVGEAALGYLARRYADPTLENLAGYTADAKLIWTATPLSTVTFTAKSAVNEVIVPGISGALSRDFVLRVDHAFRRWLIGTAQIGYGTDDYVGSNRIDHRYFGSTELAYKLSRRVWIKGQFRSDWLHSTASGANYSANLYLLGLRLQD
jgi:hypothetical protein